MNYQQVPLALIDQSIADNISNLCFDLAERFAITGNEQYNF
jgi:hypothetical protein